MHSHTVHLPLRALLTWRTICGTGEAWPTVERDHAATLSYMDRRVGGLLHTLDELRLANSTVVFQP